MMPGWCPGAAGLASLVAALTLSSGVLQAKTVSSESDELDAFEAQLDRTIRSACHGYMLDAMPDVLAPMRDWLNATSPFCQTVRTLPSAESAVPRFMAEQATHPSTALPAKELGLRLRRFYGRNDPIQLECKDWMCQHVRTEVRQKGHPISLVDYQRVAQHCEGRYECIEGWFQTWPRALPVVPPDAAASATGHPAPVPATGLSLDGLMGAVPATEVGPGASGALPGLDAPPPVDARAAGVRLDDVMVGRAQRNLDKARERIAGQQRALADACGCSIAQNACYEVSASGLASRVKEQEAARAEVCGRWSAMRDVVPRDAGEAASQAAALGKISKQVAALDDDMDSEVARWNRRQRERAAAQARAERERQDQAYMAGVLSLLAQTGGVVSGQLSSQQAAERAVAVARGVERGDSWSGAMARELAPSGGGDKGGHASGARTNGTPPSGGGSVGAGGSFACEQSGAQVCREYVLNQASQVQRFQQQCRQSGYAVLASCDHRQPRCSFRNGDGEQITYYRDPRPDELSTLRANCEAGGGRFGS